jgi:hypothetical protein
VVKNSELPSHIRDEEVVVVAILVVRCRDYWNVLGLKWGSQLMKDCAICK